jgi:hypothetical protein
MSRRHRTSACVCIGTLLISLSAVAAFAYTGTSAGRRLAGQLLGSYNHVHYLSGSVHGSVYYCPSQVAGYFEEAGSTAPASCLTSPATATWVGTLSSGRYTSAVGTVVAKHQPTITFVAGRSATFIKASGARCWTKQGIDYNFVGSPPFGFFVREYMVVGPKHGADVDLIGTMPSFQGFKETDTLSAKTHQMVGESIYFGLNHPNTEQHLLTSYHQVFQAPKIPSTSPVC